MPAKTSNRLIVAANRLPYQLMRGVDHEWLVEVGAGGLVSALVPVLRHRGGLWVGWTGAVGEDERSLTAVLEKKTKDAGYTLKPVLLTQQDKKNYYIGFANEVIWPLFHDLQANCDFDPLFWKSYLAVNQKFAEVIVANYKPGDFIWVHDYHLMHVGRVLRSRGVSEEIGFFLHIPFPSLDIFLKLPWRFEILQALLEYNLIGFQTLRDRRNFIQCVRALFDNVVVAGKGRVCRVLVYESMQAKERGDTGKAREIQIGAFPISIDYATFEERARLTQVSDLATYLHNNLIDRQMILGVDRLDYTKGIPNKLMALKHALHRYPELHHKITLIQHVVPSRVEVPQYQHLHLEIERLVSEINGEFTESGWVPVHYIYRSLKPNELLAYYRAADIVLVTPLKDGMNLVAKEYCAANIDENGVLILSEFAGAAAQLHKHALIVNPYDIEGLAEKIYQAFLMDRGESRKRMRLLRKSIRDNTIFHWVDSFLATAIKKDLSDFPILEDYIPHREAI